MKSQKKATSVLPAPNFPEDWTKMHCFLFQKIKKKIIQNTEEELLRESKRTIKQNNVKQLR